MLLVFISLIIQQKFTVSYDNLNNPKSIKFGLAAIKNVGGASIEELVNERKKMVFLKI